MTTSKRINVRSTPEDLRALKEIMDLAPRLTRSTAIRAALHLAVLITRDGPIKMRSPSGNAVDLEPEMPFAPKVVAPPLEASAQQSDHEISTTQHGFIQIRSDAEAEQHLEALRHARFAKNDSVIVRKALYLLWPFLRKCWSGWTPEIRGRESNALSLLGIRLSVPTSPGFNTKPLTPKLFSTKP